MDSSKAIKSVLKDSKFWKDFDPNLPLNSLSNNKFYKKIIELFNSNLEIKENNNNIKFIIIVVWDIYCFNPKYKFLYVGWKDKKSWKYLDPDNLMEGNFDNTIFKDYIEFLNKFNEERLKKQKIEIHFWDLLNNAKMFSTPIIFYKPNFGKSNFAYENFISINIEQQYEIKLEGLWLLKKLSYDYKEEKKDIEDIFLNLIDNYLAKTKAGAILEYPILLDVQKFDTDSWYRTAASISIGMENVNNKIELIVTDIIEKNNLKDILRIISNSEISSQSLSNALRSAVAAILGRNASHTIGSHSLSYLSEEENLKVYELTDISKFYRYLQGRFDYIAEASTTEPKWSETVEFKNQILIPFIEQKLLIDNINRSEYIIDNGNKLEMRAEKYQFELIMNNNTYIFFYNRDSNGNLILNMGRKNNDNISEYTNNDMLFDILIDCPHGVVGCHAFYSFIENFIRNSCKHGKKALENILKDKQKRLEIKIELKEEANNPDLIKITISDNLQNLEEQDKENIKKYIEGSEKDFTDDTGKLRGGAWGIYDMRIGTGWLRQANVLDISINSLEPPILKLLDNKNITYEFYLLRPLNYLYVSQDETIIEDKSKGIYKIKNLAELEELYKAKKLRHKCVIIDVKNKDDIDWLKKKENQIKLPLRTFVFYNDNSLDNDVNEIKRNFVCVKEKVINITEENVEKDIQELYAKWLYNKGDSKDVKSINLPKLNIIWSELDNNEANKVYKKENLNSVDKNAIVFKHAMDEKDIDTLKKKNVLFFQPFSSSVPENIVGRKFAKNKKNIKEIIYELYELGLFRILIADERIFKKACEKTINTLEGISLQNSYELWKVWKWMGVDIIDIKKEGKEIKILTPAEGKKGKKTINKKTIEKFFKSEADWTVFLIHQGIIDEDLKGCFDKFLRKCENHFRQIFIHSGRGEVKIEEGFKFFELSNLEKYVIDNPNKYNLINLLSRVIGGKQK